MNKIKSKWDKLDERVQKWATRLGAIATIIGFVAAGGGWLIHQVDNAVASHIEAQTTEIQTEVKNIQGEVEKLSDKVESQDKQTDLQLTRLELLTLMNDNPHNVVEIEKVARHYFQDLNGDWYMSDLYSKWAKTYGGDAEIMVK